MIYVACPPNCVSGGPELLHQLVFTINNLGGEAYIYYPNAIKNIDPTPEKFKKYNTPIILDLKKIKNLKAIIVPEVMTNILNYSVPKTCRKIIWWLSVDNYFLTHPNRSLFNKLLKLIIKGDSWNHFDFTLKEVKNYTQSEYAKEFLLQKNAQFSGFLSDFLSDDFLEAGLLAQHNIHKREDIVLYNPKKGINKTNRLIKHSPHIQFIPINNMSSEEIIKIMSKAKVYIDFGHHPGKDRIPREAAIMGCCIIVGLSGSAINDIDVPIPKENKFKTINLNIDAVIKKIETCLSDYENEYKQLEFYRNKIYKEKDVFLCQVQSFLKDISN